MIMLFPSLKPTLLAVILSSTTPLFCHGWTFQSSLDDVSYGAQMIYNEEHDEFIIVGTSWNGRKEWMNILNGDIIDPDHTNAPSCFVGTIEGNKGLKTNSQVFTTPDICTGLSLVEQHLMIAGHKVIYDDISEDVYTILQYVIGMDLDTFAGKPYIPLQEFPRVTYSVGVASSKDGVYIATHQSDSFESPKSDILGRSLYDLETPFWVGVQKRDATGHDVEWYTPVATKGGQSRLQSVETTSDGQLVVMAGSTTGQGAALGANVESVDWDGFVTKLDAGTGGLLSTDDIDEAGHHFRSTASVRIQSQTEKDDFVHDICINDATESVYVVGTTTGKMEGKVDKGAFIIKYDLNHLNEIWKHQIPGDTVHGVSCAVDQDRNVVYLGGHVSDTRVASSQAEKLHYWGKQDVFVAQYNENSGAINWMKQIGTAFHDRLASIVIAKGVPTLYGNSYIRDDNVAGTVFVMTLDPANGKFDVPLTNPTDTNSKSKKGERFVLIFILLVVPTIVAGSVWLYKQFHQSDVVIDDGKDLSHDDSADAGEINAVGATNSFDGQDDDFYPPPTTGVTMEMDSGFIKESDPPAISDENKVV